MRLKSHWFKPGKEKTPQELAGAAAFSIWRIAVQAIKNLRKADFEVAVGEQYFAYLYEFLNYLVQIADRQAYLHLQGAARGTFTIALVNRVGEIVAENRSELLGGEAAGHKARFVDLFNHRADDYAEFDYNEESGPDFGFLRYAACCVQEAADERDQHWITDQVMAIEGPEGAALVARAMRGLLELEPRRRAAGGTSGD
ncbi:MAG: hypothetical protein AB1400_05530 [Pseudomonadota bacterium]